MSMKLPGSLHSLAAAALLGVGALVATQPAFAEVFYINGTYNDGGTFSGSFDWDAET
ncbi:MAG: hypothetical protein F6K11_29585, partial [Leptolyngbya sp. SIO3F4]|nr:hypothetical protein [Leptolyngbya sp. SIO3F4]